jgi:ApeA N-terminal domain 1
MTLASGGSVLGVRPHLVRDLGVNAYPIVHGQLVDGRFVTLVQAETGLSVDGPTMLRAKYCLLGLFVVDDPQVRHAQIEFDWLDSWIDSNLFYDDESPALHVEVGAKRLVEVAVGDGVTVALASGMFGDADMRGVDLTRGSHFEIDLDKPCELSALVSDHVRPLQDLVTLCLGRSVRVSDIRIATPGQEPPDVLLECACPINQAAEEADLDPARLQAFDSPALMTGVQFIEHFDALLPAWYAARDRYAGAVIKINAPSYARFMYLENRAVIAVQAVEALHEIQFDSKQLPSSEHKKRRKAVEEAMAAAKLPADWADWAGRVLSGANRVPIVDQVSHVLSLTGAFEASLIRAVPDFAKGAAKLRSLSSHGSGTTSSHKAEDVERNHFLTELVMWALRIALLSLAGVPDVAETASRKSPVVYAIARLADVGALPPKKPEQ